MNRPPSLKGKVYECFSLYGRFVNRPYNLFKHPYKSKFEILPDPSPFNLENNGLRHAARRY